MSEVMAGPRIIAAEWTDDRYHRIIPPRSGPPIAWCVGHNARSTKEWSGTTEGALPGHCTEGAVRVKVGGRQTETERSADCLLCGERQTIDKGVERHNMRGATETHSAEGAQPCE